MKRCVVIPISKNSCGRVGSSVRPRHAGHGRARDLFLATAVVVVLRPDRLHREEFHRLLRLAPKLTEREAQIATLLSEEISLVTASDRLHPGFGTVRNHLKRYFCEDRYASTRRANRSAPLAFALEFSTIRNCRYGP